MRPLNWTRRRFLGAAGGSAAAAYLGAAGYAASGASGAAGFPGLAPPAAPQRFVTRPDLPAPALRLSRAVPAPRGRYYFLAPGPGSGPGGLMICDAAGGLVWFAPARGTTRVMDFRPQTYRGQAVLTWWEGPVVAGTGQGQGIIADRSYRRLHTVQAARGLRADLHEFLLTPQGTALITAYRTARADLSALGGPSRGYVLAGVAQEVDVATGRLLLQWDSLDHVPVTETAAALSGGTEARPFDYFHINSVAPAADGGLLISARNTWTVYQVARPGGAIRWRLGGRNSSFAMGPGTRFYWQHDARARGAAELSVFDDGASPAEEKQSRGLMLHLDTVAMRATLTREYTHPEPLLARAMGNVQLLPDGRVLAGWGTEPYFSEFSPDGRLLADGLLAGGSQSYRSFAGGWAGQPATRPDAAARAGLTGRMTVYASWNGATAVHSWLVLTGARPGALSRAAVARRSGFETGVRVPRAPFAAVAALAADGSELARSAVVTPG